MIGEDFVLCLQHPILRQGQLRVWHITRDQEFGAVPEETWYRHMVLRKTLLPLPHREHGEAHDHAARQCAARVYPVP